DWSSDVCSSDLWSRGSAASGPQRAESTLGAGAKGIVVQSNYQWSDNEEQWRARRRAQGSLEDQGWNQLIIYETHAKGLTKNAASGVEHPGSFRGFGEMADYLAELGVTAVELMPVHEKTPDGGYWGYWNISFFAPEL